MTLASKTSFRKSGLPAIALALGLAWTAAPASAYIAINTMFVQERSDGTVFVRPGPLFGDKDFWCAVGDYYLNFRRIPSSTPIFRMSEPPRPVRDGIVFSLNGKGAASKTGMTIYSKGPAGSMMTVTAFALCPAKFPWGFYGFF